MDLARGDPSIFDQIYSSAQNASGWIIYPMAFVLIVTPIQKTFIPALYPRHWSPPALSQIVYKQGTLLSHKYDSRLSYTFTEAAPERRRYELVCAPGTASNDCLDRPGLDLRNGPDVDATVGIYEAPDLYGIKDVVMSVQVEGTDIVPFQERSRFMKIDAQTEDDDRILYIFPALAGFLAEAAGMTMILAKLRRRSQRDDALTS